MISVQEAFGSETTARMKLFLQIEGSWDAENQWVVGGYAPAIFFNATPIPIGDNATGSHGESLKADRYGERNPSVMKFHSRIELPLNAIISHSGIDYKVTRRGNYLPAGYWSCVGQTEPDFNEGAITLLTTDPIFTTMTLGYGKRHVSVAQLMLRRR